MYKVQTVLLFVSISVEDKLWKMEAAIAKAKSVPVDCSNVDKKFRQLVDLTEDEANFHTKQSSFLYQLAVQTMPKSLHCLSMRLTVEYFHTSPLDVEDSVTEKYVDPELYHYVILSNNILAASVAINSTVIHAKVCSIPTHFSLSNLTFFSFVHLFIYLKFNNELLFRRVGSWYFMY